MKKAEGAKTAQELKAKYRRRRYSTKNIGVAFVADYLYKLFLQNEGISYEEQEKKHLTLFDEMITHGQIVARLTPSEERIYRGYLNLLNWIVSIFPYVVSIRDSLINDMIAIGVVLFDTLNAEITLQKAAVAKTDAKVMVDIFNRLSFDAYKPGSMRTSIVRNYLNSIDKNLKFIHAYNTFIEMAGDAVKIPELTVLKVNESGIIATQGETNETISEIKALAKERTIDSESAIIFDELSTIKSAPAIDEEILSELSKLLNSALKSVWGNWSGYFKMLKESYCDGKGVGVFNPKDEEGNFG